MTERPYTQFYARLLGGFSISFAGQELPIEANPQTKYMQLLLMLIKAGEEGIERKQLVEILRRDDGDWKKQLNNFRQQVYILRQAIARSHFPEGRYIVRKGSRYYFTFDYEVETDTGILDQLLIQIRSGPKEGEDEYQTDDYWELLWDFCKTYTGEFLPMLSGEEWVTTESGYYQKWYFDCLKKLCAMLKEQGDYERMLELCTEASQMHPYDEWQAMQIDCLMSMNRYKEARKVYEDAAQIFYEDLGITSIDQVMAKYRNTSGRFYYAAKALANVKDVLRETENRKSAYCCSYPSFLDVYHIISRMEERMEMKSLLMVCTMGENWRRKAGAEKRKASENEGRLEEGADQEIGGSQDIGKTPEFAEQQGYSDSPETWKRLDPKMEQLRQVIVGGIRNGDVYTRYSANQFLVLLIGAKERNGQDIAARLERSWKEINRDEETEISFTVETVEGPGIEGYGNEEEGYIRCTYH